jgi:hypothetical protein
MITYAAPVWSSASPTNYRHLQVYQSKCLRVIGDFPRRTPIPNLHAHLQIIPIRQFIYHLTDKFFVSCPVHPNPFIRNTRNYTLEDLHRQYTKYRHKCIKHVLLWMMSTLMSQCFFFLTLILLMWNIGWAPNNARRWQMGFNSAFKGLKCNDFSLL